MDRFLYTLPIFLICACGTGGDRAQCDSLKNAASARELAKRVNDLFHVSEGRKSGRLMYHSECTVALFAAWNRAVQMDATVSQEHSRALDTASLHRFLGVTEGRVRAAIPAWWEECFRSVRLVDEDYTVFSLPQRLCGEEPALDANQVTPIQHHDGRWLVKVHGETWFVPGITDGGPVDRASIKLSDDKVYVALYGWPPVPYVLHCMERKGDGLVLWSSNVWAAGDLLNYVGVGWHKVQLCVADDSVVVFGMSGGAAYIEVFDRNTGVNRCRFSTAYLRKVRQ